uniref:Exostosin GT47 domain-containing protein n=2 Tax=Aureoumbra lagunensis TaxID=44058 RepID=A0A7S3JTC9_9STRA
MSPSHFLLLLLFWSLQAQDVLLSSLKAKSLAKQYWEHRNRVEQVLGNYKYYVYNNEHIKKVTDDVMTAHRVEHEAQAEVWIHRAALHGVRHTLDPAQAEIFFVPVYVGFVHQKYKNEASSVIRTALKNITQSSWFQRYNGRDHIFSNGGLNPTQAKVMGFPAISQAFPYSFRGTFEINPSWIGGLGGDNNNLDRLIAIPYVVHAELFDQVRNNTKVQRGDISIFFAANERMNAIQWSGCNRSKALGLLDLDKSLIMVGKSGHYHPGGTNRQKSKSDKNVQENYLGKNHRYLIIEHSLFAEQMHAADRCLFMCGDTPTSRRLFDSIIADCIPLIVGTRVYGECVEPCHKGWGWRISGPEHPHLPFYDIYIDYSLFPVVNESLFYINAEVAVAPYLDKSHDQQLHEYLAIIKDDVLYGYGNYLTSLKFGRVAYNLLDTATLRWRSEKVNSSLAIPNYLRPSFHFSP